MTMHDVAIATCRPLPEPDPDEAPLIAALEAEGLRVLLSAWSDEEGAATLDATAVVLRSTWDYYLRPGAFLAWCEQVARERALYNSVEVVRWNISKTYLGVLSERGVRTVPTHYVEASESLSALMDARGWRDVVVKPMISAASFETHRVRRDEVDETAFEQWSSARPMMVQPYMRGVEGRGERAVVVIDGQPTHAVRKSPRFSGEVESVSEALEITSEEEALTRAALAVIDSPLLYARVDVVEDQDRGAPVIMELELIEPSLFLVQHPPALERLAKAIARRVDQR